MKALLYKEFKLAMHPICYVFVFAFPLMMLIPSYPLGIGFIYVLSCYPILFLGANKGQQSNDLLFSTLLPVRKKDIVLARIITVIIIQVAYMLLMSALWPLAHYFRQVIVSSGGLESAYQVGISLDGFVSLLSFGVIAFAIADLMFFPIYYRNGKSIVMSTLLTILVFVVFIGITTILLPIVSDAYGDLFSNSPIWLQFIFLAGAILISFVVHLAVYKMSAKKLEKVDF